MATAKLSEWTPENSNFARLCKLLIHGGTRVLKYIFDFIHPPDVLQSHLKYGTQIHTILQNLETKMFKKQWDKLYPPDGSPVTSNSFDITLMCFLLRNICDLSQPFAGLIVEINQFRNHLYGHITKPSLSDTDFNQYWDDIASVLVSLGGSQAEIDGLKRVSMDPQQEKDYIQHLKEYQDHLTYSQKLKPVMKKQLEKYQECVLSPIIENMNFDNIFTNLVMKQRQTKHSTSSYYGKSDIFPIKECKDLFFGFEENDNPKSILISGKPGVGKSLYCRKLVHEWAYGTLFDSAVSDNHPDIKYTFLLTFRQLNTLKELLNLRELLNHCSLLDGTVQIEDSARSDVMKDIFDHPEHLFIILDGYDEYQDKLNMDDIHFEKKFKNDPKSEMPVTALVSKLLKKKILRKSVVMVTSRPGEAYAMKHVKFDRYVEIAGFSEEQVYEYVGKYFKFKEELKTKALDSIKDNRDYLDIGCVPLMCLFMCVYMEEHIPKSGEGFPKTLTAFYTDVLQYIAKNYNKALKVAQLDDDTTSLDFQKMWAALGELAAAMFDHQQHDKYSFDDNDLKNLKLSNEELSYIKGSSLLFCEAGVKESYLSTDFKFKYKFTHTTIQEYFAAQHFVLNEMPVPTNHFYSYSSMVRQFMAGLMDPVKDGELMKKLLESIEYDRRVTLNCLYEYGDAQFTKSVVQENHYVDWRCSDGKIYFSGSDIKVEIMLLDIITTLNQEFEQSLASPLSLPHILHMEQSPLTRSGVESLFTSLSNEFCTITALELVDCNIGDVGAQCLSKYLAKTKLKELILYCNGITDKGLEYIAPCCNNLTKLDLCNNEITDKGMVSLTPYCNNLTHLDLSNNKITDKGLVSLAPYCNNLTHLDLSNNKITDKGLVSLAPYCNNLTHLNMDQNIKITGEGLVSIAPYFNNLTCLEMMVTSITDKDLKSILQSFDKLTELGVDANEITDKGIDEVIPLLLRRNQPIIIGLDSNRITDECKKRVREKLKDKPHIRVVFMNW